METWKKQIQWYSDNNCFSELNRIDRQPMEFAWKILTRFKTMGILNEIQQMMREIQCEPENFTGRIIFMSMFNGVAWRDNGNTEQRNQNSHKVSKYARRIPCGRWSFLGLGSEKVQRPVLIN